MVLALGRVFKSMSLKKRIQFMRRILTSRSADKVKLILLAALIYLPFRR